MQTQAALPANNLFTDLQIRQIPPQKPQSPEAQKVYARALNDLGDPEGALREVREGLKSSPNDPGLLALQQALAPHVDTSHGFAALRKAIDAWLPWKTDAGPDAASKDLQYASAIKWGLPAQGRNFDAGMRYGDLSANQAALAASKDGLLKLRMGDYSEAEKFFTSKIQQYPYDWLAYRFRALARRNLKKTQDSYDDATKAIGLNPKDGRAYDVRALALIDMMRYRDAVLDALHAIALNAKDADAWRTKALAEEKMGQRAQVLQDLKQAAELDPQYEAAYRQALEPRQEVGVPSLSRGMPSFSNNSALLLGLLALLLAGWGWAQSRRAAAMTLQMPPQMAGMPAPNAVAPALQGQNVVDHFDIVRKLGQGGMGEVFEGVDKILDRKVALKKLRDEIAHDPRERKRFIREARTVAKLQHPNIVQIFSVLERPNELYLVFELIDGKTLDRHMASHHGADGMEPSQAFDIIRQVGVALDHAHSVGIIHRDLKPSNIMIKDAAVKVMDFGIARQVQESLSTISRGEVVGTPAYMAPEQERGQAIKESDLYALGICLYEILTGCPPFPDYVGYDLKVRKSYRAISDANPKLPKELDRFMDVVFDPNPENRYHSGKEFLRAFQKAVPLV